MDESPGLPFQIENVLGIGETRYTAPEISEKSGMDIEEARRLWRAMGFVLVSDEEVFFTDADVDILRRIKRLMDDGYVDLNLVLGITRMMSQSVARLTEAETDAIRHRLAASPELIQRIFSMDEERIAEEIFGPLEAALIYVWRRHFINALQRGQVLEPQSSQDTLAIGFVDIVGFTRLSRELDERDLARLVDQFEATTQEIATDLGVRIVKTIGDEVMFVADGAREGAEMALRLTGESDDAAPVVRAGIAYGELTAHHGDYFGHTVNVASRAVGVARPATVLASEEVAEALRDEPYEIKPIARRRLKGIGNVQLHVVRRREER